MLRACCCSSSNRQGQAFRLDVSKMGGCDCTGRKGRSLHLHQYILSHEIHVSKKKIVNNFVHKYLDSIRLMGTNNAKNTIIHHLFVGYLRSQSVFDTLSIDSGLVVGLVVAVQLFMKRGSFDFAL